MPILIRVVVCAALAALLGCQTARHREFERIHEGMDKDEVIEAAGNPNKTLRWQGQDRWIYIYYPDGSKSDVKEVHFTEGRVTYRGSPVPPAVSAEDQDRLNGESNLAEARRLDAENAAAAEARQKAADDLSGEKERVSRPGGADW